MGIMHWAGRDLLRAGMRTETPVAGLVIGTVLFCVMFPKAMAMIIGGGVLLFVIGFVVFWCWVGVMEGRRSAPTPAPAPHEPTPHELWMAEFDARQANRDQT